METIGKVLSLTLLTIFGSAAATIYLVDSNIMPSFFGKPAVYTSDKTQDREVNADFYTIPERREKERENFNYTVLKEKTGDAGEYNSIKPIWGQGYDVNPVTVERSEKQAREIARINSVDSILQSINYWNSLYSTARRKGREADARSALRNYKEYREALEIKQSSGK
ncbi:MAG TPA: hypothetical protein VHC46_00095 [Thermodesulfobacteriota bacterium]|nr:hypothetical protein [Thermodesulfobacteriota bacterium]